MCHLILCNITSFAAAVAMNTWNIPLTIAKDKFVFSKTIILLYRYSHFKC